MASQNPIYADRSEYFRDEFRTTPFRVRPPKATMTERIPPAGIIKVVKEGTVTGNDRFALELHDWASYVRRRQSGTQALWR